MKRTYAPKPTDIEAKWHFIDVRGEVLGKVAAKVAKLLMGKHKAIYTPGVMVGDKVVITNASKIAVTGNKMKDKVYHRHTGFPGGLKSATMEEMMDKDSTEVVRKAVKGMLPQTKLTKKYMTNLFVYEGKEHPHEAQVESK